MLTMLSHSESSRRQQGRQSSTFLEEIGSAPPRSPFKPLALSEARPLAEDGGTCCVKTARASPGPGGKRPENFDSELDLGESLLLTAQCSARSPTFS